MILPQKLWQLVLVLTFLLVQQCCAASGTTANPYQTNAGIDKNFEVIDVSQQNLNGNKLQTGQTTRIFTAGDVDDNFWLKHLGDDFKHAIHLNVGNNNAPSAGYNLTTDGAPYKIEHEYLTNANPVQYNVNKQNEQSINQAYMKSSNSSFQQYLSASNKNTTIVGETKQTPNINLDNAQNKPFEQVFTLDHSGVNLDRFYNPKSFDIPTNSQNNKYSQYDQLRHISPKINQGFYQQKELTGIFTGNINSAKPNSPVVITLPDTRKEVHQYGGSEKAVVVKLPPVIYHSKPVYTQESTLNSKENEQQHKNTHLQSTQEKSNTNTQNSDTFKQHQNYQQLKHTQDLHQKQEPHQTTYNSQYRDHTSYHPSTSNTQKSYQNQGNNQSDHEKTHKEVQYAGSKQSNTAIYSNSQKDSGHGATNNYKHPSRST